MLGLYQGFTSVCGQKARLTLAEKGPERKSHVVALHRDHLQPAYLKLNPNGVVPPLGYDENVIVESTVIKHYLNDTFPTRNGDHQVAAPEDMARYDKLNDPWLKVSKNISDTSRRPCRLECERTSRRGKLSLLEGIPVFGIDWNATAVSSSGGLARRESTIKGFPFRPAGPGGLLAKRIKHDRSHKGGEKIWLH